MIKIQDIIQDFQNKLNAAGSLEFFIHTHTGKFKAALKKDTTTRIINGLATTLSSETQPTQSGVTLAVMSVKFEFVIRCKDTEEAVYDVDGTLIDGGNVALINEVSAQINAVASEQFVGTMTDSDNTPFALAYSFSLANSGIREQRTGIGDSFTFTVYGYYNIVQSGVNSKAITYYLDGIVMPYTAANVGRTAVIESDVYSGSDEAESSVTASSFYISLAVPAFLGKLTDIMDKFVYDGDKSVHILRIVDNSRTTAKIRDKFVFIAKGSYALSGVQNIGGQIDLSTARLDLERTPLAPTVYSGEITATRRKAIFNDLQKRDFEYYRTDTKEWVSVKGTEFNTAGNYTLELSGTNELTLISTTFIFIPFET